MDEVDLHIIEELGRDARTPFRKIAKKLGISTQTVIKRHDELKKKGIIRQPSITIDLNKVGYEGVVHLFISGSPDTVDGLKKLKNIYFITRTTGDTDIFAAMAFKNTKDFYETICRIKSMPSVKRLEVAISHPAPVFPRPPLKKINLQINP